MSDIEKSVLERALFDSIAEILMTGQTVNLEGFGSFEVIHQPSCIQESLDRTQLAEDAIPQMQMDPPADVVRFQDSNFPSK